MLRRDSTTPMDWEYQNKVGPVDASSPFMSATTTPGRKRQYSALESPLKSGLQTPDRPAFFGHGDSKPLPAMPPHVQRNAGVWAPRTPTSIADFSSGGETPRTPNQNADSDATPDASLRTKMSKMWNDTKRDGRTSPKKPGRRDSWLSFLAPSTSAKPEASRRELGASKADGRVVKRRGKQAKQLARKDDGYGSSEDGHKSKRSRKGGQRNRKDERDETPSGPTTPVEPAKSSIETFFAFIVRHPTLPHVLSFYAQLVLNLFLVFSAIYVLYWFGTAIFDEVSMQAKKTQSEVLVEIATCEMHFRDNRCDRATRVPAMESACSNWEACMKRDPSRVARASVTMKTFAIIFNSFVEEFSYKSMFFTAIVIFGGFNLSNWAFGFFRTNQVRSESYTYPPPPPTPQRHPSNGFYEQPGYPTPYGTLTRSPYVSQSMPVLPPAAMAAGHGEQEDGAEQSSPRKLMLR